MMNSRLPVVFRVCVQTKPNEVVCVVGDCDELGNWNPHRAVELNREYHLEREVWSKEIRMLSHDIKYRYFKCFVNRSDSEDDENDIKITQWETNIQPRTFCASNPAANYSDYEMEDGAAVFGLYGGNESKNRGWLTGQTEIQLRLHANPIRMFKQWHNRQCYRISCRTIDLGQQDVSMELDDEESEDLIATCFHKKIQVSVLNNTVFNEDLVKPHDDPQFGTPFTEGDYFIFKAQTFEPEFTGFRFDIYVETPAGSTDLPKHVGHAYILSSNMKETQNVRTCVIHGLRKPIGNLTVDYLIVKPMKDVNALCDMSVSYSKHWKHRPSLEVGHRGMGSSYSKECATVTENTIAAFTAAGSHGADFVEFDVQLSADLQPVIYHDFFVCLTLRGKKNKDELQLFEIPVKNLKLEQLQNLQVDHVTALSKQELDLQREDANPVDLQPFPTLETCLNEVDPNIGFNVEVKYPMALQNGDHELQGFFDRNEYLDIILACVLKNAGNRRIIFSCFDPDVCAMICAKQNKFPVQFLVTGESNKWPLYRDVTTYCKDMSTSLCLTQGFMGININAEVLMDSLNWVQFVKDLGLVIFIWGEELNEKKVIKMFKEAGVHGLIHDRISEFKSTDNVFKMENESKLKLLHSVGALVNGNETTTDITPCTFIPRSHSVHSW